MSLIVVIICKFLTQDQRETILDIPIIQLLKLHLMLRFLKLQTFLELELHLQREQAQKPSVIPMNAVAD